MKNLYINNYILKEDALSILTKKLHVHDCTRTVECCFAALSTYSVFLGVYSLPQAGSATMRGESKPHTVPIVTTNLDSGHLK